MPDFPKRISGIHLAITMAVLGGARLRVPKIETAISVVPIFLFALAGSACVSEQKPELADLSPKLSNIQAMAIQPKSATLLTGQTLPFSVTGGTPPYGYSVKGIGSISMDGAYTAPGIGGLASIVATDSNGNEATASLQISMPAGTLDFSYGSGVGYVNSGFGAKDQEINSLAIQSDGKIIAAGFLYDGSHNLFALARYNNDGSLDPSFGGSGKITTSFSTNSDDTANSVAVLPNGNILAGGESNLDGQIRIALAEFQPDGTLEPSFGNSGQAILDLSPETALCQKFVIQSDGRIVVVGPSVLARFTANGSLDTTFGAGRGWISLPNAFQGQALIQDSSAQSLGDLAVAGALSTGAKTVFSILRFTPDGSLDSSFGNEGQALNALETHAQFPSSIREQFDGSFVMAGETLDSEGSSMTLVRFTSSGSVDLSFGKNGSVKIPHANGGEESASDLQILSDGSIIASGSSIVGGQSSLLISKLNGDGSLDSGFGVLGESIITSCSTPNLCWTGNQALLIQPNGKLVLGGYQVTAADYEFNLTQLLAK